MGDTLIEIDNLTIRFQMDEQAVEAVKGISLVVPRGKTVGLVGESGSGKSVTALSIMRLLQSPPAVISGAIRLEGRNLVDVSDAVMRGIRGRRISMIFQEPMTSLNPVMAVGDQIAEIVMLHEHLTKKAAIEKGIDLLAQVGIPAPAERITFFPHQLSGGQRQRVMIAMAIACNPDLLIADEPTTALDVTIQKQILELLASLQNSYGMSVLFITHDLAVVGEIADSVVVMHKGGIVETGTCAKIFNRPVHPYTKALLACRPSLEANPRRLPTVADFMDDAGREIPIDPQVVRPQRAPRLTTDANPVLLEIKNIKMHFPGAKTWLGRPRSWTKAVDGVSMVVRKGRTMGIVGESGCGKTTLGRVILRLIEATDGEILYEGRDLRALSAEAMREARKRIQIIFQDPFASLSPRLTVGDNIIEPLAIHGVGTGRRERLAIAARMVERCGLPAAMLQRYPHELSGGQRQRVCIARALVIEPELIICDECVSALDVSIQAQVLNLLLDLQEEFNLTYIFISHDLAVVKFMADELCVINEGKIVEMSDATQIYTNPQAAYTRKLLSAIPKGFQYHSPGVDGPGT